MRKKIFRMTMVLVSLVLFVSLISFTQEDRDFKNNEYSPNYPTTTNKYRGVVSADIGDGDAAHELVCDFGSAGVWLYDYVTKWHKLSPNNPDRIIGVQFAAADYEIYADFGTLGIWWWNYTNYRGSWTKISPDNPSSALAIDDDDDGHDELQVDFGSMGLWRYDYDTTSWSQLTGDNPGSDFTRSDLWVAGWEEGVWDFGSMGTWLVYESSTFWTQLTGDSIGDDNASAECGVGGDDEEELFCDFNTQGIWVYESASAPAAWHQITGDSPWDMRTVKFVGSTDHELVACFNLVDGLWWWNYSGWPGTWTRISPDNPAGDEAFCEPFDPDGLSELSGDEELAVDFGALGLWLYNYAGTPHWQRIHTWSPSFMVRSDLRGDGVDNCLICDFGANGLWYYYGPTATWTRLTPDSPDGLGI
jgi:hypothetical protein